MKMVFESPFFMLTRLSGGSFRIHLYCHGTYIPALHGCLIFLPGAALRLAVAAAPVSTGTASAPPSEAGRCSFLLLVCPNLFLLSPTHPYINARPKTRQALFFLIQLHNAHKAGYGNAGCNQAIAHDKFYPGSQSSCNPL